MGRDTSLPTRNVCRVGLREHSTETIRSPLVSSFSSPVPRRKVEGGRNPSVKNVVDVERYLMSR